MFHDFGIQFYLRKCFYFDVAIHNENAKKIMGDPNSVIDIFVN